MQLLVTLKFFYSDDDALQFIKNHQILFDSVQPVDNKAIFTSLQTGVRFTSIAVESMQVKETNVSVIYIGKSKTNAFISLRKNRKSQTAILISLLKCVENLFKIYKFLFSFFFK